MEGLLLIFSLAVFAWLWNDNLKAKESALLVCSSFCKKHSVQFLDQTVRLSRIKFVKNTEGRYGFRRLYAFDCSVSGYDRGFGTVIIFATQAEYIRLEHPDGPISSGKLPA
ncbi:MAG: DUF3301 domain-containing protein [Pseudomonadota bacterium]